MIIYQMALAHQSQISQILSGLVALLVIVAAMRCRKTSR